MSTPPMPDHSVIRSRLAGRPVSDLWTIVVQTQRDPPRFEIHRDDCRAMKHAESRGLDTFGPYEYGDLEDEFDYPPTHESMRLMPCCEPAEGTRSAADLIREVVAADPEAYDRVLARAHGVGPIMVGIGEEQVQAICEAIVPAIAAAVREQVAAEIAASGAKALRDFADAHRMPWTMFRRNNGRAVTVGDLLREEADRLTRLARGGEL